MSECFVLVYRYRDYYSCASEPSRCARYHEYCYQPVIGSALKKLMQEAREGMPISEPMALC